MMTRQIIEESDNSFQYMGHGEIGDNDFFDEKGSSSSSSESRSHFYKSVNIQKDGLNAKAVQPIHGHRISKTSPGKRESGQL